MFSTYHSRLCYIINFCILLSPVFGALVNFAADLTWELGAPDGQQRYVIHTNGRFPGPPLLLKQGDSVEVREHGAPASLSLLNLSSVYRYQPSTLSYNYTFSWDRV